MLGINHRIQIPLREFEFQYARSSGAGGQNVNKVNSKAILHWDVVASAAPTSDVRARFLARYAHRITKHGALVLQSQRFRDQGRNTADCLEKLRSMLLAVAAPPRPRKETKPTIAAKGRRLEKKRIRSEKKRTRKRVHPSDD